ncbi:hypothetical protein JXO52_01640 [bacterium]|nr:hypothetical protein [bacterium]
MNSVVDIDKTGRKKIRRAKGVCLLSLIMVIIAASAASIYPCTMFRLTVAGKTLVGNNEDFRLPSSKYWIDPAGADGYGVLFFGFNTFSPQGGMNDQGLVFDGFSAPEKPVRDYHGKKPYDGNILRGVMKNCATVKEVEEFLARYDLRWLSGAQLMFADAAGHSVIVEGDDMIHSEASYQIATNFYQSEIADPREITCRRYLAAERLLSANPEPTVAFCTAVLDSVHAERDLGGTQYSMVYDPAEKLVYLYLFHNYRECVTIDLPAELALGAHSADLADLFEDTQVYVEYRTTYAAAEMLSGSLQSERDSTALADLGTRFTDNRLAVYFTAGMDVRADILLRQEKYVRAAGLFRVLSRLFPDSGRYSLGLGESLAALGDTIGARIALQRVKQTDSHYERAQRRVAELDRPVK